MTEPEPILSYKQLEAECLRLQTALRELTSAGGCLRGPANQREHTQRWAAFEAAYHKALPLTK